MASKGSVQDLSESRAQALQAILTSLASTDASHGGTPNKLTSEQVRKLSDKLGEIVGDVGLDNTDIQRRNEKGELVNEEGLPIVDINEPLHDIESPATRDPPEELADEPNIPPLWALSPAEKERRRAERDRLLDLLEEEERLEREREEAAERERFKSELEKRKEAAKAELESLRKARELQKRMGRALLKNAAETEERESKMKAANEQDGPSPQPKRPQAKQGKSVTFADSPSEDVAESQPSIDWGDVTPGRLEGKRKAPLLSKAQMNQQPMKMNVVERQPGTAQHSTASAPALDQDSDDESIPGSPVPADSDEGDVIPLETYDDNSFSPPESSDEEGSAEDDELVEWGDEELDYAQHQREIALAYYEKRATIGASTLSAMRSHSHDEDEWDQAEVPIEATLASPPPKPSTSRFKADRLDSAGLRSSTLPSHSLGTAVLPSAHAPSLRRAIRMGSLEDEKLVGGESDDDMEEAAREVLEMLKRGEVTNIGPQQSSQKGASPQPTTKEPSTATQSNDTPQTGQSTANNSPKPSRVSKFKMTLNQGQTRNRSSAPSAADTPLSVVERSSPKMDTPATAIALPSSSSRPPARSNKASQSHSVAMNATPGPTPQSRPKMPGMIIDSPSFPATPASASPSVLSHAVKMPGMIVESPSFPAPFAKPPSVRPSPPTMAATSPQSSKSGIALTPTVAPSTIEPSSRSGSVMASEVKESSRKGDSVAAAEDTTPKKVSRFRMERM